MAAEAPIQDIKAYLKGIALSYANIYFSRSFWLGLVLLLVSFFDFGTGISGLIAIVVCQLCSRLLSFNKISVFDGSHSYNALMVGLALGSLYQVNSGYLIILVIASALSFLLTVWIAGRMQVIGLPFLSLPFLITICILLFGLPNFTGIRLTEKSVFSLNQWIPGLFEYLSNLLPTSRLSDIVHLYLRSLSANIFQYNDLAGIVIAIALFIRSRMAFALSIYGFLIGYGFYYFFEGDYTPLIYSYIGFNFILTAIALGGFFLVPSTKSHLLLLFAIPVTALLLSSLHTLFSSLNLPLYSFPFNIIVLLVLGALQMRYQSKGLELVTIQQYSPEDNHYKSVYYHRRFAGQYYHHLYLPVMGEWHISQGYKGNITHKAEWQHALDFDVRDEHGGTFRNTGYDVKDYHCYDLPVLAPAAGYVIKIKDGIRDNAVGASNLNDNWGNTVIIKHAEGLYTKLSHLKQNSFKVKEGSYVYPGEMIATCGSSGRSPEPHLHFQVQANPYIGSQTISYPIASYLVKEKDTYSFHSFSIPNEGEQVRNIIANPLLYNAFDFVPGKEFVWSVSRNDTTEQEQWSVYVDIYNRKYIYSKANKASAYFYNDGTIFYFIDFYGGKSSFLYLFYLSFQKVLLGHYKGVVLKDSLLPQTFFNPAVMAVQDIVAPFYHFLKGEYRFSFATRDNDWEGIHILTESHGILFGKKVQEQIASMSIDNNGMVAIQINQGKMKVKATCV